MSALDESLTRLPNGAQAFVCMPEGERRGGLVMLAGLPGMTEAFRDRCRDMARDGWAVCAPELITDDPTVDFAGRDALVASVDDEDALKTLRLAAEHTGSRRVCLLGFCIGGTYALKGQSLGIFECVVAFYGVLRIPERWKAPGQGEPLEFVRNLRTPVLAVTAGLDEFVPQADVDELEAAGVSVVRYPAAGHAFAHDPSHPNYRAGDAVDAWRQVTAFLDGNTRTS